MKTSDLFVKCLEQEGIPVILGVPGEENADIMMSLEESPIQFIMTRHEQGAAFAASTYGKLTGNPLGVLATLGPGAANLVTGIADANMDHAPMLALTGQGSTRRLHKESHQIMDVVAMCHPITKWATSIRTPDAVPETLRKAVRIARSEKPGAVLVELPEDIASMDTNAKPMEPHRYRRPVPDKISIQEAAKLVLEAKRPMILAGNGAVRLRASASLRQFAEFHALPVTSTFMGKGSIARTSDQCLFTVGIQQKDQIGRLLGDADVVIAVGYDLVEFPPANWVGKETRIVHLDFTAAEIDSAYHPEVELIGDIAGGLDRLHNALKHAQSSVARYTQASHIRNEMLDELSAHASDDSVGMIKPQKMLWDIRKALGPNDVLLSGVGAHKMWVGRHYHCDEPNTCLIPNGFCSMGQPLPGLIGAKLARPNDRCVALCGDGDFLMNVQEMETIARLGLDVTAIVWEDHAYGLIAWKQEAEFGKHTKLSFGNPNWIGLAEAFGWRGERADNSADFSAALHRSLEHRGPSLLIANVDYRENMKLTERLGKQICRI